MSLHADALHSLEAWRPAGEDQEDLRQLFVRHLHEHPDGLLRSCRAAHITASTLVTTRYADEVMLVLHGKAGRWFQFGGHCEDGDTTLHGAALRELEEESGLEEFALDPVPVHLDAHPVPFCGPDGSVHLDVRFVAVADRPEATDGIDGPAPTTPDGSPEGDLVAWWPVDGLPTEEPSLLALIQAARRRLGH